MPLFFIFLSFSSLFQHPFSSPFDCPHSKSFKITRRPSSSRTISVFFFANVGTKASYFPSVFFANAEQVTNDIKIVLLEISHISTIKDSSKPIYSLNGYFSFFTLVVVQILCSFFHSRFQLFFFHNIFSSSLSSSLALFP